MLTLCLCCIAPVKAANRILIEAKVNGQSVRLAFDTGAETSVLFRRTVKRLKLKVTEPPPSAKAGPGKILFGKTEEFRFELGHIKTTTTFGVFDLPQHVAPGMDGLLAWADVREAIWRFDAETKKVSTLKALPENMDLWTGWKIREDSPLLEIRLPSDSGKDETIFIDTGAPFGVQLSPKRWKQWRDQHADQPASVQAFYTPSIGTRVCEELWADSLSIGKFSLGNVPVMECPRAQALMFTNLQASLGLFALTRFDMIIDGENASIYTRSIPKPTARYQYNRLGVVFLPANMKSDHLIAHVAEKSPGQAAGIRNGDVLLRVGDLDATKWRTDPRVRPLDRFWSQRAGAKVHLTIGRDNQTIQVEVTLKELFPQGGGDKSASPKRRHGQPDAPTAADASHR